LVINVRRAPAIELNPKSWTLKEESKSKG
jgi:hypothetical protein